MKAAAKIGAAICVCSAGLAAPTAAAPTTRPPPRPAGAVTGTLTGLPAATGVRFSSVYAVRLSDLTVVAGARLRTSPAYKLRVPAGPYILAADSVDSGGAYQGLSNPRTVKAGSTRKLDVPMRSVTARARSLAGFRSTAAGSFGKVVGVSPNVRVTSPDYPRGIPLDGMLIAQISNNAGCAKEISLVEVKHRQDILKELQLQRSSAVDPATRVTPHLLTPEYMVEGGGAIDASGSYTIDLRTVDVRTGKTVSQATTSGDASALLESIPGLSDRLMSDLCKPKPEPPKAPGPKGKLMLAFKGTQTYEKRYHSSAQVFCPNGSLGNATTTEDRLTTLTFATLRPYEAAVLESRGRAFGLLTKPMSLRVTVSDRWSHVETFCGSSRPTAMPACETPNHTFNSVMLIATKAGAPGKLMPLGGGGTGHCLVSLGVKGSEVSLDLRRLTKPGTVNASGHGVEDWTVPPSGGVLESVERRTLDWQITLTRR